MLLVTISKVTYVPLINIPYFLSPSTEQEIHKEILKLKSKQSADHDFILPKLLKHNVLSFTKPINYLINLSLETAIVPNKFKIAKVIPI